MNNTYQSRSLTLTGFITIGIVKSNKHSTNNKWTLRNGHECTTLPYYSAGQHNTTIFFQSCIYVRIAQINTFQNCHFFVCPNSNLVYFNIKIPPINSFWLSESNPSLQLGWKNLWGVWIIRKYFALPGHWTHRPAVLTYISKNTITTTPFNLALLSSSMLYDQLPLGKTIKI